MYLPKCFVWHCCRYAANIPIISALCMFSAYLSQLTGVEFDSGAVKLTQFMEESSVSEMIRNSRRGSTSGRQQFSKVALMLPSSSEGVMVNCRMQVTPYTKSGRIVGHSMYVTAVVVSVRVRWHPI